MIPHRTLARAVALAALAGLAAPATAQLANTGFEIGDLDQFADFDWFPNTFADWTNVPDRQFSNPILMETTPALVHTGAASAKVFGQFNGSPNASLVTQDLAATPGNLYEIDVWALHSSTDPILGVSAGFASIEFYDGVSPTALTITTYDVTNAASLQDLYQQTIFSATAPAGATIARVGLGHFQLNNSETGATYYDDADLLDLGANTGLQNAGFDTYVPTVDFQPDPCCIPGWEKPGGNAYINRTFKQSGNSALIFFGGFTGADNTAVVYQDLPAPPGELVSVSSVVGQITGDTLQLDNVAFMSLEFYGVGPVPIQITRLSMLDATSPVDVFLPGNVLATAPAGTTTARVQFGFFQSARTTTMPPIQQGAGAAYFDDAEIDFLGPNTGLINGGFDSFFPDPFFEPDPDQFIPQWAANVAPTSVNFGQTTNSNSGEFAAFIFGQFPGDNSPNDTVLFQDFAVAAGAGVQIDAKVYHDTSDPLGPDNVLSMTLQFLDAGNAPIGGPIATLALDAASPQSVYLPASVSGTAPGGAAKGRINFVYSQANEGGGAALIDDVVLAITPPPPCVGDLNGDNATDVLDFAVFLSAFGNNLGDPGYNAAADYDNNNTINVLDFAIWVADFGCPN